METVSAASSAASTERYFALDGLRAVMMLLGVVLHAGLAYATWTFSVRSAYHDTAHTAVLSGLGFLIHLFRMPVFFMMAGFFGGLLWARRGLRAFWHNRLRRVVLPLLGSWLVLFPLTVVCAAITMLGGPKGIAHVVQQLQSGALLAQNNLTFGELLTQLGLIHLWFLYFLVIFYGAATLLLLGLRRLPSVKAWVDAAFRQVAGRPVGVLLLAAVTWATLLPMRPATKDVTGIEGSNAFLPPLAILLAYFVFFGFGWLLFRHRHLLAYLRVRAWAYTGLGLAAAGLYAIALLQPGLTSAHWQQAGLAAPAIWLLSLGTVGLALRYFTEPTGLLRYLSDASYWVYLVHLPLTLLLPGLLIGLPLPALLKFLLTCAATAGLSLLTYHYWVRTTRLGQWLNGRRLAPYALFGRARKTTAASVEASPL